MKPDKNLESSTLKELRIVTWNVQVDINKKLFNNNWEERKSVLLEAIEDESPDVLCLQEALYTQLQDISSRLSSYGRIGSGRDDGKEEGEHCAILYDRKRFDLLDSDTFWFSDVPEGPTETWDFLFKRICTWAQLADRESNGPIWVFNTHFPLNPFAQSKAARLLMERIESITNDRTIFLCGDFNCTPSAEARKIFSEAGLLHSEIMSGKKAPSRTFHFKGHRLFSWDAIYVSPGVEVKEHRVLKNRKEGVYPSDHFGLSLLAGVPKRGDIVVSASSFGAREGGR